MKLKDRLMKELERLMKKLADYFKWNTEEPEQETQEEEQEPEQEDESQEEPQEDSEQEPEQETHEEPAQEEVKPQEEPKLKIESFGSPNCAKAKEDPNTRIKELRMSKSGLTYKWEKGSLRNWGIKDDHEASALAVAGYGDGQTFKCAKFDWISTDRLTRGFENIDGGYNGFNAEAFHKAAHRCFFIMAKDGSKRTNVLVD